MSETLHSLMLTKQLWNFVIDHLHYFFQVILEANICADYERVRLLLTPFQINHINIKRKTQNFKLITKEEHTEEFRQMQELMKNKQNTGEKTEPPPKEVN